MILDRNITLVTYMYVCIYKYKYRICQIDQQLYFL